MVDEKILERLSKSKDADVKELLRDYLLIIENPIAQLYGDLANAANGLRKHIANKTLDLKDDTFQISVFMFLKEADKIFVSMEKGKATFEKNSDSDKQTKKKVEKAEAVAIG